jgi:hypothetical protein
MFPGWGRKGPKPLMHGQPSLDWLPTGSLHGLHIVRAASPIRASQILGYGEAGAAVPVYLLRSLERIARSQHASCFPTTTSRMGLALETAVASVQYRKACSVDATQHANIMLACNPGQPHCARSPGCGPPRGLSL